MEEFILTIHPLLSVERRDGFIYVRYHDETCILDMRRKIQTFRSKNHLCMYPLGGFPRGQFEVAQFITKEFGIRYPSKSVEKLLGTRHAAPEATPPKRPKIDEVKRVLEEFPNEVLNIKDQSLMFFDKQYSARFFNQNFLATFGVDPKVKDVEAVQVEEKIFEPEEFKIQYGFINIY